MIDISWRIEAELGHLRRFARALAHNDMATDDLVQESLAHALSRLHLWNEGTDFRAWLFTILYHQYIDLIRRSSRERAALLFWRQEIVSSYAPVQYHRLEIRDLERALTNLPERQRSIVLAAGLKGTQLLRLAADAGVSVASIRSCLSRGRAKLREGVGESVLFD